MSPERKRLNSVCGVANVVSKMKQILKKKRTTKREGDALTSYLDRLKKNLKVLSNPRYVRIVLRSTVQQVEMEILKQQKETQVGEFDMMKSYSIFLPGNNVENVI